MKQTTQKKVPENKFLGSLCKRGHDWIGTRKSLKYKNGRTCVECIRERKQRPEVKARKSEYMKEYRQRPEVKAMHREYMREYNHHPEAKAWQRKYQNKKNQIPQNALRNSISAAMNKSLKNGKNGRHWEHLLGYTLSDLMKHIEKQFEPRMTWNNYGEWHIDHIIPISVFNFEKPADIDFQKAWALDNLQPLWAHKNLQKSLSKF